MTLSLDFALAEYRADLRQARHSHDELHLSLVVRGSLRETVGGESAMVGPLTVLSKDPGVAHGNEFGPRTVTIARLSVHSRGIADLVEDRDRAPSWQIRADLALARPFLRLMRRARACRTSFESDDTDVCDLLAALTARVSPPRQGLPPAWLRQTIDELRTRWSPRTSVADVARRAGVHPVYLARCVRRWFGHGVGDELRQLRLAAAADAVARGGATVSSIAHHVGYADESHLCRDFQRSLGITPGSYRQAAEVSPIQGKAGRIG